MKIEIGILTWNNLFIKDIKYRGDSPSILILIFKFNKTFFLIKIF